MDLYFLCNIVGHTEPTFLQKRTFFRRNIEIFIYHVLPAYKVENGWLKTDKIPAANFFDPLYLNFFMVG